MALATDCNPGTSPVLSMPEAVALGCAVYGLAPLEALAAATANPAWVLGLDDRLGSLEPGKRADLVVLDLHLPGMSGLDVCRLLRAEPATSRMLILLLTAKAQEQDVETGFGAGADDYVVKPFSPRELVTRLSALEARARR
jgi:two-component system, OmpR family, phosphate regulon response regulator PhoB